MVSYMDKTENVLSNRKYYAADEKAHTISICCAVSVSHQYDTYILGVFFQIYVKRYKKLLADVMTLNVIIVLFQSQRK